MCKGPEALGTTIVKLKVREQEGHLGLNKARDKQEAECAVLRKLCSGFWSLFLEQCKPLKKDRLESDVSRLKKFYSRFLKKGKTTVGQRGKEWKS